MDKHFLSVIVCTYNRDEILDYCLASLCEQQLSSELYEVIVVDNNSQDNTAEVVSSYMNKKENIRYVTEKKQGLSHARNRGCEKAKGEYLVYVDDDAKMDGQYLLNVLEVIKTYEPDILGGPIYPYYTDNKPRWFRDEYEIRKYEEKSGFSKMCSVSGSNFIIKKDLLKNLGMFDPDFGMKGSKIDIGEERKVLDIYRERTPDSDQKVYYALECYVWHHVPQYKMKMDCFMKRYYISGKTCVRIKGKRFGVIGIVWLAVKVPLKFVWRITSELFRRGPISADYMAVCRLIFHDIGMIIGLLDQLKEKSGKYELKGRPLDKKLE